jgi:putative DNA primase/helicase
MPVPDPLRALLDVGLDLIPLRYKIPKDKGWRTAVYAAADLARHFDPEKLANVGIRLRPGQLVLDYDGRRDFPCGDEDPATWKTSLQRFAAEVGLDLTTCPTTRTPGGGVHVFLTMPEGLRVKAMLDGFPGLEFKAHGRQVVAPGSRHPEPQNPRQPYYAHDPATPFFDAAPPAPAALLERIAKKRKPPHAGAKSGSAGVGSVSPAYLAKMLAKHDVLAYRGDHARWLELMTACHAATGGSAEACDVFVDWSTSDPHYAGDVDSIASRWESFDANEPGGITARTLFQHLRDAGWEYEPPPIEELFPDDLDELDFSPPPERPKLWGSGLTDTANAARFVLDHVGRVRFVEELNSWIAWDGRRWAPDLGLAAERLARETVRGLEREALAVSDTEKRGTALKFAIRSHQAGALAAMVRVARADLAVKAAELDAHPELLSTQSGVLDLRTGGCSAPDPSLLITKLAPTEYHAGARCPLWERFLGEVLPDASVRAAFQRFVGYALAGGQGAKAFAIVIGPPDSGKSTALGAIADTLGSDATEGGGSVTRAYVATATMEAFARRGGGNSPELARLAGARLILINEIPEGRALESSAAKAWTGGDVVNATPKYGHPLSFKPDGKLCLVGNVMPGLDFTDDALWERVIVFPFEQSIPEAKRDRGLRARFDRAGILAWAVEGHRAYREQGLSVPEVCRLARAQRREEADPLRELWALVVEREGAWLPSGTLWSAYQLWANRECIRAADRLTQTALMRLAVKRFGERAMSHGVRGWRGLAVGGE